MSDLTAEIIAKAKKLGAEYAAPNADCERLGWEPVYGFDKREAIAVAALQGLLACPHQMCGDIENQVGLAVEYADKLLQELCK